MHQKHNRLSPVRSLYEHFPSQATIISYACCSVCSLVHVKFGRVTGMSTRGGTAVFLSDILEESKERMLVKMGSSPSEYCLQRARRSAVVCNTKLG